MYVSLGNVAEGLTEDDERNLNPEEQNEKMLSIYRPVLSKIPVSL